MEEELLKKIKTIEKKVNANATELKNHIEEISGNKKQIQQNTSALEILRTFKADTRNQRQAPDESMTPTRVRKHTSPHYR